MKLAAKNKESGVEKPAPIHDEEDEATLAAVDEGLRDAKSGRKHSRRTNSRAPAQVDFHLVFTQRSAIDR